METDIYRIQTDYFEGPLDLLLHLIRKNKMDIMEVKIADITSEYLEYLKEKKGINPSREGDFLMTASTLIYIKSRSLLPKPDSMDETPEEKLMQTLIEYDKIQKISHLLRNLEGAELMLWRREEVLEDMIEKEFNIEDVSSFQLAEVFFSMVRKKEQEEFLLIESKEYSIERKRNEILGAINAEGYLNFSEYIEGLDSLQEILVSFFTLLEMIKQGMVIGIQKKLFDTINVWRNDAHRIHQ